MLDMIIIGFIAALICPLIIGLWPMFTTNDIKYFDSEFLSDEESMFPADWNLTIKAHVGNTQSNCLCKVCALDAPKKITKAVKKTVEILFPAMPTVRPLPLGIIDMMPKSQVKPSFIRFNHSNSFDLSDVRMVA